MFERDLTSDAILGVIRDGDPMADYPNDQPYPSCLMLGFVAGDPAHVVVARDSKSGRCFVVTAYQPDPTLWEDDFRKRRQL
jgi:hypothetical protein